MTSPLQRLRELRAKATPGPWGLDDEDNSHCMITAGKDEGMWNYVAQAWEREEDAVLIVAMHNALPVLLDVAEAAQDVLSGNLKALAEARLSAALGRLKVTAP